MPFAMPPLPADTRVEILDIKAHYYVHRENFEAFASLFETKGPSPSRGHRVDPDTGRPVCDYANFDLIGVDPAVDDPRLQPHVTVTVRGLRVLATSLAARGHRVLEGPRRQGDRWQLLVTDNEGHVYEYVEDAAQKPALALVAGKQAWRPSQLVCPTPG